MAVSRISDDHDVINFAVLLPQCVSNEQLPCEDEERLQRIHQQATEELI